MMALDLIRTLLVVAMILSVVTRDRSVRGSRNRYRASSVFRATVIPVTVLLAVSTVVSLAAGDWWGMFPSGFLLAVMPLYFKFANDEDDDWWTGRWTKIRKGITAALGKTASAPATQH